MGESYLTDTGDVVTRTVLPSPLVGYYESTRLSTVTFEGPFSIDQEKAASLRTLLAELFSYPDGEHFLHAESGPGRVFVTSRVAVTLNVGVENENSDLQHLHTLLSRLQATSDSIEVTGNPSEPRVRQALVDAGFRPVADFDQAQYATGPAGHVAVPYQLVWRRDT